MRRSTRLLNGAHDRAHTSLSLYRRLLGQARPYWLHLGILLGLSLLSTPLALLTPLPLKIAVDSALGSHPLPGFVAAFVPTSAAHSRSSALVVAVVLLVLVALLNQLQQLISTVLGTYTTERLVLGLRERLFLHAERLSLARHDRKGTSDAVYRVQWDAASMQYVVVDGLMPVFSAVFMLGGMIYVSTRIDWVLALVALAICPVLIALTMASSGRFRGGWKDAKRLQSSAFGVVQEALGVLRVVKAFGQERREHDRFVCYADQGVRARVRLAVKEAVFGVLAGLTIAAGTGTVLFIGVHHVERGTLTLGELVLIMGYLALIFQPLRLISQTAVALQGALASADRAFSLLDEPPDVPDLGRRRLVRARGAFVFEDVSFAYDDERPVLRGISFEVVPGERVGISGMTGAGKTTLVSLITRFYDPSAGRILLDGVDLRDYALADLRNQCATVFQDSVLFSTSLAENIAYAYPDASIEEITAAAVAANADEFIRALPHGYESIVGERGLTLSGGERQRIALARAFLKNAPILILDEPTSSLDLTTEAIIIEAMERLIAGRTTFMIAHRLSTLEHCDIRLEMKDGRIVDRRQRPFALDQAVGTR
jgi:ATP-binding cassette subfamily B protein